MRVIVTRVRVRVRIRLRVRVRMKISVMMTTRICLRTSASSQSEKVWECA